MSSEKKVYDDEKPFKILSIDGGGIRGIYPAKFLAELEEQISREGKKFTGLHEYFDLICGTSTGGIIALGIALGMKASEILKLYTDYADKIFLNKRLKLLKLISNTAAYNSKNLEKLLKEYFSPFSDNSDTRLGHAKTRVCIPVFNSFYGRVSVLKTSHHPELKRDYQYPAHDVALSTSAAPFYFKPHSFEYSKTDTKEKSRVTNLIDGGVAANNPSLIGLIEANQTLGVPVDQIKLLSIGTGETAFRTNNKQNKWGLWFWAKPTKPRIIELMFAAQSDNVDNLVKFLNQGVGSVSERTFLYERIQFEFPNGTGINLDETKRQNFNFLQEQADNDFQIHGSQIIREFCESRVTPYEPIYKL